MFPSSPIADLLRRFVDDRDALQEHEYAQLAEAIKQSPELAQQLRDQLVVDDFLSQKLAIDRRHFDAQMQQRIADHLRGEDELNEQASELRLLALARLGVAPVEPGKSRSTIIAWGTALVVLLAVGLGTWSWRQTQRAALTAVVAEVSGRVLIQRFPHGNDLEAALGQSLQTDDRVVLDDGAALALTWPDGTRVQLDGGARVSLPATTTGKRLDLLEGDLAASVSPQPSGRPLVLVTPHADAIVRGTELYLQVRAGHTKLQVLEGEVEFVERETQAVQLVESSQEATAGVGVNVATHQIRWPTSQQGIIYLLSHGQRAPQVRTGELLRPTTPILHGDGAEINERGELELSGGWYEDPLAGASIANQLGTADAMSLEIVFASRQSEDDGPRRIVELSFGAHAWQLLQAGQRLQLQAGTGEPHEIGIVTEVGKLTHLAITYRSSQGRHHMQAYVDGVLVRTYSLERALPFGEPALVLGGQDAPVRWHGRIAGLAVYNRALEDAEIHRNFSGVVPR